MVTEIVKTQTMNSGLMAEIINFKNVHNIDVKFENGEIVRKKDYKRFLLGQIKCPMMFYERGNDIICENPNTRDKFIISKESLSIVVSERFWHIDKTTGYVKAGSGKYLHRAIMMPKDKLLVDHKNGDKLDNRICNLRVCDSFENSHNSATPKTSKTKFKGVTKMYNGKYRAKITNHHKQIHIGYFNNIKDAILAYNEKAKELFGEFARKNNINDLLQTKVIPEKPTWLK